MADFAAVLRKTIDGLGENTPEMREKVYTKARAAIEKKLASITPKPAQAVIDRQMKALETAIAEVESDFTVADEPLEDLDRILEEAGEAVAPEKRPQASAGEVGEVFDGQAKADENAPEPAEPVAMAEEVAPAPETPVVTTKGPEHELEETGGPDAIFAALHQRDKEKKSSSGRWRVPAVIVVLLIVLGAGAWFQRDMIKRYTGFDIAALTSSRTAKVPEKPKPAPVKKADEGAVPAAKQPENKQKEAATPEESKPPQKFTQRLTADGKEVDSGPAEGTPAIGEGSSVASASQSTGNSDQQSSAADQQTQKQVVAVGQKAYLYEEGTSTDQATAEAGNVVWSEIQEKPGGNAPEEPAIHGVLNIPSKNVTLKITIRRNADQTLPASHIIEVLFEAPDGFGGGGITEMSRVAMKDSEQATGSPLLGVPAKISDGFFLVALTDAKAAIDTNTTLLQRGEWIDIPVVYASGRRALFTMEKGIPGNRVFEEVMKAWQDSSAAAN